MKMRNLWPALMRTACGVRLWVRYKLPWKTKARLRDELRQRSDEHQHAIGGLREYDLALERKAEEVYHLRGDLNAAREEAKGERAARLKLEGQRIQEHEALRGLMFGLSNGLESTVGLINEFIVQLPDFTPDQIARTKVMEGLVKQQMDIG